MRKSGITKRGAPGTEDGHKVREVWIDPKRCVVEVGENEIGTLLKARGEIYGPFCGYAAIANDLKKVVREGSKYSHMSVRQAEALDMILSKIARIVNGDPSHEDNWVDIGGYAELGRGKGI